ncbi:MAG: S9 family peptidase [Bryobacterales bacterium]|nr:S9 family peptidase [Bryobacterales bacterium]
MVWIRLAVAACLLVPAFAGPHRITHERMWLMKRTGAPQPSPDGKWVVVPVAEPAYAPDGERRDLWLLPADGSAAPRQITFTRAGESGVAWSPDSRQIAFSTRRDGDTEAQIYVLDIAGGGEAVRVTNLSTGASDPRWSPDGKRLLFNSSVYPGAADDAANRRIAADRAARKYSARVFNGFPIRYWDKWLDDRQVHLFVQAAEPGAEPRDLLAGTQLAAGPGFGGSRGIAGESVQAAWTPDSTQIVFGATTERHHSARAITPFHLWAVPASGGEPRRLTSGEDSYDKPEFSKDGAFLYCEYAPHSEFVFNNNRVARFSWRDGVTGDRTIVSAGLDRNVDAFALAPDGRTVYVLAGDAGHDRIFALPSAGGAPRPVFEAAAGNYANLGVAGTAIIATWESAAHPPEVVRIDPGAREHRQLTRFAAPAAGAIDLPPLREFWFTSKRGKKIHSFLALPPAFDENRKYPLLVLMHGGPHAMWKDQFVIRWNYHLLAAPGYVVLLTNYTGSTGFGESFARQIQGDPLKGPGEEIVEAAHEAARRFSFIDGEKQAAAGASYGGHLANWMQATTTHFKCLIGHAGLISLEGQWATSDVIYHREVNNGGPPWEGSPVWNDQSPIQFAKNFRTPMLLTVGEKDYRVPMNETLAAWSVLQRLNIPSRLIVFPEANHWIQRGEDSRFFYEQVHAWLGEYLR